MKSVLSRNNIRVSVVSLFTEFPLRLEFVNSDTTLPLMLYTLLRNCCNKSIFIFV